MKPDLTCVVVGLGYIGLPTAVMLARHDMAVIGVDINETIVTRVNAGTERHPLLPVVRCRVGRHPRDGARLRGA